MTFSPAAYQTISRFFEDTGFDPVSYDMIFTGDLGNIGHEILKNLLIENNINVSKNLDDCGCMIFDSKSQGTKAGGSGCGCIASVFCGHFLPAFINKKIKRGLFVATGALMSPTTCGQGKPIIGIAHGVIIEN